MKNLGNLGRGTARIESIESFARRRNTLSAYKVIMTSGGFDPIHPGHLTSFLDAKARYEDDSGPYVPKPLVVVVVNGDSFLCDKKGRAFQDLKTRCQIVSCCRGVDVVIPFEKPGDSTVCEAIRLIRPDVFAKGGDRTGIENIPEWGVCQELGVEVATGFGEDKLWSSSDFLKRWEKPFRDYIEIVENKC